MTAFPIEPVHFESAIGELKDKTFKDLMSRFLIKLILSEHLDEVDPLAKAIGAVNTVA